MKLEFSLKSFEGSSNIKFPQNPSSGSRVAPCGRKDRQTDMTKLIVAFRSFAKAPKKSICTLSENYQRSTFSTDALRALQSSTGRHGFGVACHDKAQLCGGN